MNLSSYIRVSKKDTVKYLIPIVVGACCLAVTALASASPWVRGCANHEPYSPYVQWQITGPSHVGMSAQTAQSIDLRLGYEEFSGKRNPISAVPCYVAQAVGNRLVGAWPNWRGANGTIGVSVDVYGGSPYIGRFRCSAATLNGGTTICHHDADSQAGAITVRMNLHYNAHVKSS
jgi:hypothetical protein